MHVRRWITTVLTLAIALSPLSPTSALVTPERVIGERHVEEALPFANDAWFAWSANSERRPRQFNAFARPIDGGPRVKLNAAGTGGFTGSFDPGTNTVIYQQVGRGSRLFLYDLDTDDRRRVPHVNSPAWEWSPRISNGHVLFNRDTVRNGRLFTTMWITDRSTGASRKIDRWRARAVFAPTGGIGDAYATYTVCTRRTCNAFVYTIAARTSRAIPSELPVYGPVADEANGDLYFFRSGFGCGRNAAIWRLPLNDLGATPEKIVDLADGFDSGTAVSSLAPNADVAGSHDLYFDRAVCRTREIDTFVARDVTSEVGATAVGRTAAGGRRSTAGFRRFLTPDPARP